MNLPDESSSLSQTIYKETYRSFYPRRVQFAYSDVKIPRCKSCKEVHSKRSKKQSLIIVSSIIIGAVIGLSAGYFFILGGVLGLIIGLIVNKVAQQSEMKKGIKNDTVSTLKSHPLLVERIQQGWTFHKPVA